MVFLARAYQRSLRTRLIYLSSAMALLAAVLVGYAFHQRAAEQAKSRAVDALAASARLASQQLAAPFSLLRYDALAVSRTPPIAGVIRSSRNGGVDPLDNSSATQWRERLESIFVAMMRQRPYYTQMRYIGVGDGGRELVRVNRRGDSFERVAPSALQRKGQRPYFRRAMAVSRDTAVFSDVSDNIEHGVVEGDGVLTIRALVPVFSSDGRRFGFIAINSNIEMMLSQAVSGLDLPQDVYVALEGGAYLERAAGAASAVFHRPPHGSASPIVAGIVENEFLSEVIDVGHGVAAVAPVETQGVGGKLGVALALFETNESLFAGATDLAWEMALLGVVLTLGVTILAGALARSISRPLAEVAETLLEENIDDLLQELPVERVDEIGALSRSVTQRIKALRAREMKAEAVLENASEGIITIDSDGRIERYNAACETIFGFDAAEALGRNISVLMPAEHRQKHTGYIRSFIDKGQSSVMGERREMRGVRKDGQIVPIELTVMDVKIGGRVLITGIVRDITERKAAEAERNALIQKLAKSNKELEAFAYVASHDLKAPLRTIDNASRWIEEDIAEHLDDETRENLDLLKNRVARMDKLLDDLLAYSRIGSKEEAEEIVSGQELIEDVIALQTSRPGFVIEFSDAFRDVTVSRMPLQQVFHNLVGNAIKHHDRSTGRIVIGVVEDGDHYRFSIADDGPGIPESFHAQIFEMFQTLRPRDQVEGSGMGLAMVRKYVELAGGEISLRSKEGVGSEFTFTWRKPLAADGREPDVDAFHAGETRLAVAS